MSNKGKTYKNRGIERGEYTIVEKSFREVSEAINAEDPDFPVKTVSGVKQMMVRAFYKLALNIASDMLNKSKGNEEVKTKARNICEQEWFHQLIVEGLIRQDEEKRQEKVENSI